MNKRIICIVLTVLTILVAAASAGLFSANFLTSTVVTAPAAQDYIEMGKFYLSTHNILAARNQFKLAVQVEPANQEANFLYGVTRIAAVAEDGQTLNSAGLDSVREIFELAGVVFTKFSIYDTTFSAPEQIASGTPQTGAILEFLKTKMLPEVDGAIANLEAVSSTSFVSEIDPVSFSKTSGAVLTADYADALVTKAMLHALKCNLELLLVYGPDVNLPDIQAAPDELMTYKQLFLQDPAFLTPKETIRLETARASLVNFIDTYSVAAQYLIARTGSAHHLFVVDVALTDEVTTAETTGLNDFKKALSEIKASLNGPYQYSFAPNILLNSRNRFVDLSKFFNAATPINFRNSLNDLASGVPDATTINGLFPLGIAGFEQRLLTYGADILGVTGEGPGTPFIVVTPVSKLVMDPAYLPPEPFTIKNVGTAQLKISSIGLLGTQRADFTLDLGTCGNTFPIKLNPGGSCSVTVDLIHPVSGGMKSSLLQINSNDTSNQNVAIPIQGYGMSQTPLVPPISSLPFNPIALFVDKSTTDTLYVAGNQSNYSVAPYYNGSGVYKSTDGGVTWTQMKNGIATDYAGGDPYVYAFTMSPNNSQSLLFSTSSGVYRSINGGTLWSSITDLASKYISGFAFAPSTPAIIYAASNDNLYKSTNSGMNWSNIGALPSNPYPTSLVVDPSTPSTLYIGTYYGVYKTVNSGLTWSQVSSTYTSDLKFISTTLYAVTSDGIGRSTDGGVNWETITIDGNSYFYGIASDPSSPQTIYVYSYYGIFKSSDGGTTWSSLADSQGLDVNMLAVSSIDNKLYASVQRYNETTGTYDNEIYKLSTTIVPPPPSYDLSILRDGTGNGTITYSGTAFNFSNYYPTVSFIPNTVCVSTGTCGGSFLENSQLTISAQPDPGSIFTGWKGCEKVNGLNCEVRLFAPQTVTATFNRDTKPLTVLASPPGGTYAAPPEVSLAASKSATIYYTLDGTAPNATSAKYTAPIMMPSVWLTTLKYIAIDPFGVASSVGIENYIDLTADTKLTVQANGPGVGQINSDTGGITCSSSGTGKCDMVYPNRTPVTLTVTTRDDSTFYGWSGDCSGFAPCIMTMTTNKNVIAQFGFGPGDLGPKAKIGMTGYNSVNDAYSAAGADVDILIGAGSHSIGDLVMDQIKNITLIGGYNTFFSHTTAQPTLLKGTLTIQNGSIRVQGVALQ
jgi:photosystem II stability/assembly factor-like uncharacterized protein